MDDYWISGQILSESFWVFSEPRVKTEPTYAVKTKGLILIFFV